MYRNLLFAFAFIITNVLFATLPFQKINADTFVSVFSPTPGSTITAGTTVTFTVSGAAAAYPGYMLSDSFGGSSISNSNIADNGSFSWTPNAHDIGTHTITISAHNESNAVITGSIQLMVTAPASVAVLSTPGGPVQAGLPATFSVSALGFSDPSFTVSDSFSGSSVGNGNINSSGNFSWTPTYNDAGTHTITVSVTDTLGHSGSGSATIVVNASPTVSMQNLMPGPAIQPGTTLTFNVITSGFSSTSYSVSDSFIGSSVTAVNINQSGNFSWTPTTTDLGSHTIGIFASDPFNHSGSVNTTVTVYSSTTPTNAFVPVPTSYAPSTPASGLTETQIQAILGLLLSFGADQTVITNVSNALRGGNSTGGKFTFTQSLHLGMSGSEVTALQQKLASLGIYSGPTSGYFGPMTEAAVKAFQKQKGLEQVGSVGPGTRAALNAN